MIFESARPKPEAGGRDNLSLLQFLTMAAGTLTPVLLFLHLVGAVTMAGQGSPMPLALATISTGNWGAGAGAALLVGVAALIGAIALASITGLIIANAAPALGRTLQTPGAILSLLVFGFTLYVTWSLAWWIVTHPVAIVVRAPA